MRIAAMHSNAFASLLGTNITVTKELTTCDVMFVYGKNIPFDEKRGQTKIIQFKADNGENVVGTNADLVVSDNNYIDQLWR
jgi:hypothetical protein